MSNERTLCTIANVQGGEIVRGNAEASTLFLDLKMTDSGQMMQLRLPMLDALYLLNFLRAMESDCAFRQRNRQDKDRILVGRVPRVGLSSMTTADDPWSRRVQIEIVDRTDDSSWKVELTLQDAMFLHNEFGAIRARLGLSPQN